MIARLFSSYVHETTHATIRRIKNDLNASSPVLSNGNIKEAGFEAERNLCGAAIDWRFSLFECFDSETLKKFIDSVCNDKVHEIAKFHHIDPSYIRSSKSFCLEIEETRELEL
jgi:hypothetical protein